ncbi:MAG: hypothetical protein ABR992_14025 [Solirubrobacteraceae bacterium]|jgi:uncharacterized protein YjeT (DUF2065 family)
MSYRRTAGSTSSISKRKSTVKTRKAVPANARALLLAGGAVHIVYGLGSLLTPESMVCAHYAPDTHDLADPRLLLRAFGGHLLVSGCLTLTAMRSPRRARSAAVLCLLINSFDVTSAIIELRARGTIKGGIALSGAGVATFAAALCALRH